MVWGEGNAQIKEYDLTKRLVRKFPTLILSFDAFRIGMLHRHLGRQAIKPKKIEEKGTLTAPT